MSSKIFTYTYMTAIINNVPYRFGSPFKPVSTTIASDLPYQKVATIAAAGTTTMFDISTDLADFDYMLLAVDFDAYVEIITNDGDALVQVNTLPLTGSGVAKEFGSPFILGRDDAHSSDHVEGWGTVGTLDVIEKISIHNVTGASNSVQAICMAFT